MLQLGRFSFFDPWPLMTWAPMPGPAVYAILARGLGPQRTVRQVLYIGETGDLANRGFPDRHEKFPSWVHASGSRLNLEIAYLSCFGLLDWQRQQIEAELIQRFRPPCNVQRPEPWAPASRW